tara:strand:- start:16091 stop:16468 length:378 start_codon:yes stop_codon:yes gene_type:complete
MINGKISGCDKSCNCPCPKETAKDDLKKCQESRKKQSEQISQLKKKMFAMSIAIAVVVGVVSKETIDKVVEYFQTYDKVKQAIDNVSQSPNDYEIGIPMYSGVSPSPSALAVFGLPLLMPCKRRR